MAWAAQCGGPARRAQAGIEEFAWTGPAHSIHRAGLDESSRNSSLAFEVEAQRGWSVMLLTETLDPPPRLLCGPGPSDVEPAVLAAMRRSMLGHLDPDVPRHPRRGRRAAPRRLADARRRRAGAPVDRHRRDGRGAREPARAGRHRDRRRGRLLRPPDGRRRRAPRCPGGARDGAVGRDRAERGAARRAGPAPAGAARRRRARRDVDGRAPPAGGARVGDARHRRAAARRLRDVARRDPARRGRVGGRLRVQLHAEVPRGASGDGAGGDLAARVAADPRAPGAGAVQPRPRAAAALLDRAARGVPPHGADPRASTRCTRRCGSCSRRGSRRAGRGTRPPAPRCRTRSATAGSTSSPIPSARWRRSPRSACRTRSTGARSRRGCSPGTGSRSAAGSGRTRRRCGGSG